MSARIRRILDRLRAPLREIGLNTVAFGMIVAVQQVLVFPGISRLTDATGFSQVILLITISTIVVNVIGTEASKVSLIRSETYRRLGIPWDSPRLVLVSTMAVTILLSAVAMFAQVPGHLILQYLMITLLGIFRSYATTPDKYLGAFHRVVLVHGVYAVGAVGGLLLTPMTGSPYTAFLVAELLSAMAVVIVRLRRREVSLTMRRTEQYRSTLRPFLTLALIALLINMVSYLDRLTITPLIGASALAVYYSATALSSSLSLLTNPMGNAMLARLGRMSHERRGQMFSRGLLLAVPLVITCWVGSFAIAFIGLVVLYPAHLQAALPLLAPVSLAAAFTNAIALLAPLLQRFLPIRRLLWFYLPYAVIYLCAITGFSMLWGLSGFAWASALSNATLFLMYLVQIRRTARAASDSPAAPSEPHPSDDALSPTADPDRGTAQASTDDRTSSAAPGGELEALPCSEASLSAAVRTSSARER